MYDFLLNILERYKVPLITNGDGTTTPWFDFEFSQYTEVENGCSVIFQNKAFVFGGESYTRQIRKRQQTLYVTCIKLISVVHYYFLRHN